MGSRWDVNLGDYGCGGGSLQVIGYFLVDVIHGGCGATVCDGGGVAQRVWCRAASFAGMDPRWSGLYKVCRAAGETPSCAWAGRRH